jgi:5'-deoxynucleotidase YfbR-like HD superfamily hydrolase
MALIHDLAECIVGDITPYDTKVCTKEEKQKLEHDAIHRIASFLEAMETNEATGSSIGSPRNQLLELFNEYEERQSPEAIAVKDMDLLDLILQADAYEKYINKIIGISMNSFSIHHPRDSRQILFESMQKKFMNDGNVDGRRQLELK